MDTVELSTQGDQSRSDAANGKDNLGLRCSEIEYGLFSKVAYHLDLEEFKKELCTMLVKQVQWTLVISTSLISTAYLEIKIWSLLNMEI